MPAGLEKPMFFWKSFIFFGYCFLGSKGYLGF